MPFKKMGQKTIQSRYSNQIIQFFSQASDLAQFFESDRIFQQKYIFIYFQNNIVYTIARTLNELGIIGWTYI